MDKYLRKISGLVATLNKLERVHCHAARRGYRQFESFIFKYRSMEPKFYERLGTHNIEFHSDKKMMLWEDFDSVVRGSYQPAWGGFQPSVVYLFDGYIRDKSDLSPIVTFLRKAINNGGLDGMSFGTIKVVSNMTDYLNVIEEK